MKCVYLVRYDYWENGEWKIGRTKNLNHRMKAYKTTNGSQPNIIFCLPCVEENVLENMYHKRFRAQRVVGKREHFYLTDCNISELLKEGFYKYCGEYTCESVLEKIEALESKMEKEIEKIYTEAKEKLQSVKKNYEIEIMNFRISLEREKEFHKELLKQEEAVKKLTKEAELNKEDTIKDKLFKFLQENTIYNYGVAIEMDDIRKNFSVWIGHNVSKLDLTVFGRVEKRFEIERFHSCKECKRKHKRGCCEKYTSKGRTTKRLVRNIDWMEK